MTPSGLVRRSVTRQLRGFGPRASRRAFASTPSRRPSTVLSVPGEGDEVAPVAVLEEEPGGGRGSPAVSGLVEARKPLIDRMGGLDSGIRHGVRLN
jgi:hypothetical protein